MSVPTSAIKRSLNFQSIPDAPPMFVPQDSISVPPLAPPLIPIDSLTSMPPLAPPITPHKDSTFVPAFVSLTTPVKGLKLPVAPPLMSPYKIRESREKRRLRLLNQGKSNAEKKMPKTRIEKTALSEFLKKEIENITSKLITISNDIKKINREIEEATTKRDSTKKSIENVQQIKADAIQLQQEVLMELEGHENIGLIEEDAKTQIQEFDERLEKLTIELEEKEAQCLNVFQAVEARKFSYEEQQFLLEGERDYFTLQRRSLKKVPNVPSFSSTMPNTDKLAFDAFEAEFSIDVFGNLDSYTKGERALLKRYLELNAFCPDQELHGALFFAIRKGKGYKPVTRKILSEEVFKYDIVYEYNNRKIAVEGEKTKAVLNEEAEEKESELAISMSSENLNNQEELRKIKEMAEAEVKKAQEEAQESVIKERQVRQEVEKQKEAVVEQLKSLHIELTQVLESKAEAEKKARAAEEREKQERMAREAAQAEVKANIVVVKSRGSTLSAKGW